MPSLNAPYSPEKDSLVLYRSCEFVALNILKRVLAGYFYGKVPFKAASYSDERLGVILASISNSFFPDEVSFDEYNVSPIKSGTALSEYQ